MQFTIQHYHLTSLEETEALSLETVKSNCEVGHYILCSEGNEAFKQFASVQDFDHFVNHYRHMLHRYCELTNITLQQCRWFNSFLHVTILTLRKQVIEATNADS